MKKILTIGFLVLYSYIKAQDECTNATFISDVTNFCSANAAYTNASATQSNDILPSCFTQSNQDVWFKFVAVASNINIDVYGDINGRGTLQQPQISFYKGNCSAFLQSSCASSTNNFTTLTTDGLLVGETYFIRINSRNNRSGTFQLCINNFLPPSVPGQDCNTAAFICTKNTVSFDFRNGAGSVQNEAQGTCLDGNGGSSESNSVWLKFTCAQSGTLTYDIVPASFGDIDWVLYELPNGINNCSNKTALRCNAAGDNQGTNEEECQGATGLSLNDNDVNEAPGCNEGNNKYCKYIDMIAGKSYALMINNFSNAGSGFNITFGGTSLFSGSIANFTTDKLIHCGPTNITFTSTSQNAIQYDWNFGINASPNTANTEGPHIVNYPIGVHTAVLTTTSAGGCKDFKDVSIVIGDLEINGTTTETDCQTPSGSIRINITKGTPPFLYSIDNGNTFTSTTSYSIVENGLSAGFYNIIVKDAVNCEQYLNLNIINRGGFRSLNTITRDENCDAKNGSILLEIAGGQAPYKYSIDNGINFITTNNLQQAFNNLNSGTYNIVIEDATNCRLTQIIILRKLNDLQILNILKTPATCTVADGSILVQISGGTAPYSYSKDGIQFLSSNNSTFTFNNLREGIYFIQVRDFYGCQINQIINLGNRSGFIIDNFRTKDEYCFGGNGQISINLAGGVSPYNYSIDNGQTFSHNPNNDTTFNNLSANNYTILVEDSRGCRAFEYIPLLNNPGINLAGIAATNPSCEKANGVLIPFCSGGMPPYTFEWEDTVRNIIYNDSVLRNVYSSIYVLTIKDMQGCVIKDTITLGDTPIPHFQAFPIDTTILETDGIILYTTGDNGTLTWTPPQFLSCTICPTPVAHPVGDSKYIATLTNSFGCSSKDTCIIRVKSILKDLSHPSAFSPNSDNQNDVVFPNGINVREILFYRIYNRWGELLFEQKNFPANDASYGWNGIYKNNEVNVGVYVYYVEAIMKNGKKEIIKGDFLLNK